MEIGSCVKCAETFSACGCGSKAAEDAPIPADPRVSPLNTGLYSPSDTPEMAAEMEDETFICARSGKITHFDRGYDVPNIGMVHEDHMTKEDLEAWDRYNALHNPDSYSMAAENPPVPADPRVSPLNKGLHSPSDTPEMAAEMKDSHLTVSQRVLRAVHDQYPALYEDIEEGTQFPPEELEDTGDYDDAVDIAETMQLVRLLSADIRNASEPIREFYDITKTYSRGVENEMYAESFAAESQKLGIIYRIDRDDKTADILGVLPSYAEGKKAMTYMFKSALEEYSEDSEEDLMSFSDGKKEFAWSESRSKKKKSLDFYHPTGYEDIIIVLQEYKIETLTDFYDMINEGKFSAETFNAESFAAMSEAEKANNRFYRARNKAMQKFIDNPENAPLVLGWVAGQLLFSQEIVKDSKWDGRVLKFINVYHTDADGKVNHSLRSGEYPHNAYPELKRQGKIDSDKSRYAKVEDDSGRMSLWTYSFKDKDGEQKTYSSRLGHPAQDVIGGVLQGALTLPSFITAEIPAILELRRKESRKRLTELRKFSKIQIDLDKEAIARGQIGAEEIAQIMLGIKTLNAESFGAESKFDKLAKEIAEEYEEKGKSPKEAMEIGEATAANIGRAKFGKKKFAKMGQKAEDDIDFDKSKADRNKDGRISDWERAVGNKVAKGIRESKRAEVGPHVPTRIAATTTPRGVVKTYTSIPAGDGHVVGQFTPDMDYAPSGMYGAESLTSSIEKGFGAVLGIMSGLIVGGFAMGAVSSLSKDDENRE